MNFHLIGDSEVEEALKHHEHLRRTGAAGAKQRCDVRSCCCCGMYRSVCSVWLMLANPPLIVIGIAVFVLCMYARVGGDLYEGMSRQALWFTYVGVGLAAIGLLGWFSGYRDRPTISILTYMYVVSFVLAALILIVCGWTFLTDIFDTWLGRNWEKYRDVFPVSYANLTAEAASSRLRDELWEHQWIVVIGGGILVVYMLSNILAAACVATWDVLASNLFMVGNVFDAIVAAVIITLGAVLSNGAVWQLMVATSVPGGILFLVAITGICASCCRIKPLMFCFISYQCLVMLALIGTGIAMLAAPDSFSGQLDEDAMANIIKNFAIGALTVEDVENFVTAGIDLIGILLLVAGGICLAVLVLGAFRLGAMYHREELEHEEVKELGLDAEAHHLEDSKFMSRAQQLHKSKSSPHDAQDCGGARGGVPRGQEDARAAPRHDGEEGASEARGAPPGPHGSPRRCGAQGEEHGIAVRAGQARTATVPRTAARAGEAVRATRDANNARAPPLPRAD